MFTLWAHSLNICERSCLLFSPTIHTFFAKDPPQKINIVETVKCFAEKENMTANFEMYLAKAHPKYFGPRCLNSEIGKGACRSIKPTHNSLL